MSDADAWAARLASGAPLAERVAIVVAHPDDEALWTGALLGRLGNGSLIHLTDGAPEDMRDACRLGFAAREDYAAVRAGELDRALAALGYTGDRRGYKLRDQETVFHLDPLVRRLEGDLRGAAVVITHPYEGGHPDHDTAALAVRRAVDRLDVPVVEFACYCQQDGERWFGRFSPDRAASEHSRVLLPDEAERIDAALIAHASQAAVFGDWRPVAECWRGAPRYDFAAPPPVEAALYDGFGWSLTSERWRAIAARELAPC